MRFERAEDLGESSFVCPPRSKRHCAEKMATSLPQMNGNQTEHLSGTVNEMSATAVRNKHASQNTRIKRDLVNESAATQTRETYSKVNEAFRRKANETKMMVEQLERAENKTLLEIDQMENSIRQLREASRKTLLPTELNTKRLALREKLPAVDEVDDAKDVVKKGLQEEKYALAHMNDDVTKAMAGSKQMLSVLSKSLEKVGSALLDKREGYFRDLEALGISPGHEGKNVTIYQPAPPSDNLNRSISPRKRMAKSQSIKHIQPKGTPSLDEETLQQFRQSFQDADKDGSGTISASEFSQVYSAAGVDLGPLADAAHERIDSDGDNRINFDEFVTHMAKARVSLQEKEDGEESMPSTNDGTTVGWRNNTKNVFQNAMATVGQSQSCRNQNKHFVEYLADQVPILARKCQLAFRRQITESTTMRDQLSARVSETQLELKQQARCAGRLQQSIREYQEPLEVCQMRIAQRQTRPARELVRDQVTQVLEVEYQQLNDSIAQLEQELKQCQDEMSILKSTLKELQAAHTIRVCFIKINTQCVNLRKKLEANASRKKRGNRPTLVLP